MRLKQRCSNVFFVSGLASPSSSSSSSPLSTMSTLDVSIGVDPVKVSGFSPMKK